MDLEEQIHNTLIFQNTKVGKKKFQERRTLSGDSIAHFEQIVQFGRLTEYAKGRRGSNSKKVIWNQIVQGFKYQALELCS